MKTKIRTVHIGGGLTIEVAETFRDRMARRLEAVFESHHTVPRRVGGRRVTVWLGAGRWTFGVAFEPHRFELHLGPLMVRAVAPCGCER